MIEINHISEELPYLIFKKKYEQAVNAGQKNIEAISISSYNKELDLVDSRFVNLKFINNKNFIFFSNYNSPKSLAFKSKNQISALIYWSSTNIQIRMRACIKKTTAEYNKNYFKKRSKNKNAIAISSNQSDPISSFEDIQKNYLNSINDDNLKDCPDYWGGFSFAPYFFEFWEGHEHRLNKRDVYEKIGNDWNHFIVQP